MKLIAMVLALASLAAAQEMRATVDMEPHDGTMNVTGHLTITQSAANAPVRIVGVLTGLKPGKHGFHVHEKADFSNACISAGSHFNPLNKSHGGPGDMSRHVGDLGNVIADADGTVHLDIMDHVISLVGPNSIINRAVVVHSDSDDLGKGGHALSATTGNAGSRLACGPVRLV